jgi:hypothetical protein
MACRDDRFSFDVLEDLGTMAEIMQQVMAADGSDTLSDVLDQDTRWRLEDALERAKRARRPRDGRFRDAR